MKKTLLFLLLASCTVTKPTPVRNTDATVLFFCKESDDSNEPNRNKALSWTKRLQERFPDLNFVSRSFNVESSKEFKEQLQNAINEVKPKATLSYQYSPYIRYQAKNKYVFILSDSSNNMIKDKVYHDYAWLAMPDILPEFANELEKLEAKYKK